MFTIFSEPSAAYTVIGGDTLLKDKQSRPGLTLVILNRGGRPLRADYFTELNRMDIAEIISVESAQPSYDLEDLSSRFPQMRFLIFREEVTVGEMVNTAVREASTEYVFILWNDIHLMPTVISGRVFSLIAERGDLCVVPSLQNSRGENEPVCIIPVSDKKGELRTLPIEEDRTRVPSLYPYDFMGIYDRERFLNIEGYDTGIRNPYWQKMDFGFRCFMKGERIVINPSLKMTHQSDILAEEDVTADSDYSLFLLKNCLLKIRQDKAFLPGINFLSFWKLSGLPWKTARILFRRVDRWIALNSRSYAADALTVIDTWEIKE